MNEIQVVQNPITSYIGVVEESHFQGKMYVLTTGIDEADALIREEAGNTDWESRYNLYQDTK